MSDQKFAGRLRDNLPNARLPEFDAIAADVSGLLPASSTVDAIIEKLSYGIVDWAITDGKPWRRSTCSRRCRANSWRSR